MFTGPHLKGFLGSLLGRLVTSNMGVHPSTPVMSGISESSWNHGPAQRGYPPLRGPEIAWFYAMLVTDRKKGHGDVRLAPDLGTPGKPASPRGHGTVPGLLSLREPSSKLSEAGTFLFRTWLQSLQTVRNMAVSLGSAED